MRRPRSLFLAARDHKGRMMMTEKTKAALPVCSAFESGVMHTFDDAGWQPECYL